MSGSEPHVAAPGNVSSAELQRLSGASYRQIDHWTQRGYLQDVPTLRRGSGIRREYRKREVNVAKLLVAMSNMGAMRFGQARPVYLDELLKRVRRHGLKGEHRFGALTFHLDYMDDGNE